MEHITSRTNPLISLVRRLRDDRKTRRREGLFLCDGVKMLEEAIKWKAPLQTVLLSEDLADTPVPGGIRTVTIPGDLMRSVSPMEAPQGALFLVKAPDLRPPDKLEGSRYLVLDGLQDPGNVGTVWRTADAFGAAGLFLIDGCADPFSPKTIRSTMGACFRLPVWETGWERLKPLLDAAGIPLYATALRSDTEDVRGAALGRAAVIIGSVGRGVAGQAL